jgi:hemoglobin
VSGVGISLHFEYGEYQMKNHFAAKTLILLVLLGFAMPYAAAQQGGGNQSLYTRLGGYDAIVAVTQDFVTRLVTDPQLGRFFVGLNDTSKARVEAHVIDFLCKATGGPCIYTGQDMKTAHTGLHITEADWNASATDLTATLNKFKVPAKEQGEVMAAIGGLKGDIVGR